ncbi:Crp/Fnr family transcriptional regulator [Ornithinibacillus halophilus]|uniref:CRP/FNR family transcriptional regulator, anaerobic regulatory protein n=1 Tax=Ornithinibacillus halophilus TaxID=930117 RepID=A0A1M5LYF8_9BACI|nr:Crp/Fnr family transcriptional regulator [Ornithinibacillus halophilus]SHG69960.1 CRP/FNR family transcriptional regulator, anaerobic regulatory protein [Ornithinibacillus halophilus]
MIPLLERLDNKHINLIQANSKSIEVSRGELIFSEGDDAKYFYFIKKGEVRVFKQMGKDKEITIFTRFIHDGFGEIGIFSGTKYSNTAVASKKCTLFYIEKAKIEKIIEENGLLGLQFTRWVAESLEASKAKIRDYIAFGSEGAVASVFIRYANMYGIVTKDGIRITHPIMLRDVSKHIGVSRETVSRVVNKWKEKGIITNENKYFLIKNIRYFHRLLVCEKCAVENCVL